MSHTGFGTAFTINRKRVAAALQFLMYLDASKSLSQAWTDRAAVPVTVTNGTTSGSESTDCSLAPFGYRAKGAQLLGGTLGLASSTKAEFTVWAVVTRDDLDNSDPICYGLFGDTHYCRMYFKKTGADRQLICEVRLDGTVRTITVSAVDTWIKAGRASLIVYRGRATTGMEVLIDGTSRGTASNTGTGFTTNTGAFLLAKDSNLSYFLSGELRGFGVIDSYISDANLLILKNMLAYEGYFETYRDFLSKWSGSGSVTGTAAAVGTSPFMATRSNTNVTATAGFEEKSDRDTGYIKISAATGTGSAFLSLGLTNGAQTITSGIAKTLPGVIAGNTITVYAELYADLLGGSRAAAIEVEFFNDSGTKIGSTTTISISAAAVWEQKKQAITVPATATRVNVTPKATCGNGETISVWFANLRIV